MAKDILMDENYDLAFANGDFSIGESDLQETDLILRTNQGEWKEDPITGAGLLQYVNGKVPLSEIKARIKLQLARDGKDYDSLIQKFSVK